jgi:hypothetical protein
MFTCSSVKATPLAQRRHSPVHPFGGASLNIQTLADLNRLLFQLLSGWNGTSVHCCGVVENCPGRFRKDFSPNAGKPQKHRLGQASMEFPNMNAASPSAV